MLYLIIIGLSMLLIILANAVLSLPAYTVGGLPGVALSTVCGTAAVIAWDGLQALLIRRLIPTVCFAPDSRLFAVGKRERALYRRLRINSWKHLIPELGGFTNFHKREFTAPSDTVYLGRFLLESNYGVVIHLTNVLLGPAILLLPVCAELTVWLPIAFVNAALSLAPLAVLRFNTAPLRSIYLHHQRKTLPAP